MFQDYDIVLFVFVPLATVILFLSAYIGGIPDGKYEIYVGVRLGQDQLETRVPADLFVSSEIDYVERETSAGGWDHTTTDTYSRKYFNIDALYIGERSEENRMYVEIEVEPGHTVKTWIGDVRAEITLDNLSAATLGVSLKDEWDGQSTSNKVCVFISLLCSVFGFSQYFALDAGRRRARK